MSNIYEHYRHPKRKESLNATQNTQSSPRPTCLLATCTLDTYYTCDVQIQSGTTLNFVDLCNAGCLGGDC